MNTNHDSFENDLRALQRRELPVGWRNEILHATITKPVPRAPRWLVMGWSLAWAAILLMYFTTPSEPVSPTPMMQASPGLLWEQRAALIEKLLAAN